jgi:hypothetical protein
MTPRRFFAIWFLAALLLAALCAVPFGAGCYYGDLTVHGKNCSNQPGEERTCPGGLICVESPISRTEVRGLCIEEGTALTCQAPTFCNTNENWIEECQADGYSTRVKEDCADSSLQCNPDTALCAHSCEDSDMDCPQTDGVQTCDVGTKLCRPFEECDKCATTPGEDVTAPSAPKLDCFNDPVQPPPTDPTTCNLTGRVNMFPMKNSLQTVGLQVILRPAGDPDTTVADTTVFETPCVTMPGNCGNFEFLDVPTNQAYDLEIRQPDGWVGDPVTPTFRAGVVLRANRCVDGLFSISLNVMPVSTYQSYTSGLIDDEAYLSKRGLLIGRVLDCGTSLGEERQPLGNVKVGLTNSPTPPGRIYYFPDGPVLAPDASLSTTTTKGYYAVVGVPSCRNQIEFAARQVSRLDLGVVSFTMRPGVAIIIDTPHPLDMLPP